MVMALERQMQIEDVRNHPVEIVTMLRNLLFSGTQVTPDPKRADFYEIEDAGLVYYIHISPISGKILLLATWPSEAALAAASHEAA
jgi:hypothetical protein